jgi:hypothetical protein
VAHWYREGLARVSPSTWETLPMELALVGSGSFSFDIDDTAATQLDLDTYELDVDNYVRKAAAPGTPTWDSPVWRLPAGSFVWSALGVDEDVFGAVLLDVTDDTDDTTKVPLVWFEFVDEFDDPTPDVLDGGTYTVTVSTSGLAVVQAGG